MRGIKNSVLQRFRKRRTERESNTTSSMHLAPWWVRHFTEYGRPVMAVVVLVMCAPAERHLAGVVGWSGSKTLDACAWGMAVVSAGYAGLSAAVASYRPLLSARVGAVLSLVYAMGAQATAHLVDTGWISITPRPAVWMVVTVSCAPPLMLGHMLHLAHVRPGSNGQFGILRRRDDRPATAAAGGWVTVPDGARTLALVPPADPRPAAAPTVPAPRRPASAWATVPRGAALLPIVARPTPVTWLPVAGIERWTGRANSTVRGWMTQNRVKVGTAANGIILIAAESVPEEHQGNPAALAALAAEFDPQWSMAA